VEIRKKKEGERFRTWRKNGERARMIKILRWMGVRVNDLIGIKFKQIIKNNICTCVTQKKVIFGI